MKVKDAYDEKFQALKEIEEDIRKSKDLPCSSTGKFLNHPTSIKQWVQPKHHQNSSTILHGI